MNQKYSLIAENPGGFLVDAQQARMLYEEIWRLLSPNDNRLALVLGNFAEPERVTLDILWQLGREDLTAEDKFFYFGNLPYREILMYQSVVSVLNGGIDL